MFDVVIPSFVSTSSPSCFNSTRHNSFTPLSSFHSSRRKTCSEISDKRRQQPTQHLRCPVQQPSQPGLNNSIGRYQSSVSHPELRVFTRTWEPPVIHSNQTRYGAHAGMLIIPAFIWHGAWFNRIAENVSALGCRVIAIDPLSTGRSDDLDNIRWNISSFEKDHVIDIIHVLKQLKTSLPPKAPMFILTESSGAIPTCLLSLSLLQHEINITGWILCAPAIKFHPSIFPPTPILKVVQHVIAPLFPRLPAPQNSDGSFDLAFGDGISSTVAKQDPFVMVNTSIPLQTMCAFLNAHEKVNHALKQGQVSMLNALVLHNEKDKRTLYAGSQLLVDFVVGTATLVDPGGDAHQLFQERGDVTLKVIQDIVAFVDRLINNYSIKTLY